MNILTRNSATTLSRALDSVREFSEIIVCDGGSTDDTVSIALRAGCVVIQQSQQFLDGSGRLVDYAGPRNQMLQASTHDWVFQLDSDEYATADLVDAIDGVCASESSGSIYEVGARYELAGEVISCASSYPIWHRRLFNTRSVGLFVGAINENVSAQSVPQRIEECFIIPLPHLRLLLRKWSRYLRIAFSSYRIATDEQRRVSRRGARSSIRWFLRNLRGSLESCRGRRLSARYEVARFAYYVANYSGYRAIDLQLRLRDVGRLLHRD